MNLSDAPPPPPQRHGAISAADRDTDRRSSRPTSPSERVATSARKYVQELPSWSPRDSRQSTETVDGTDLSSDCDHATKVATTQQGRDDDEEENEFHDIALDGSAGVVPKSIFKEKKGFLTRLMRDASSSVRGKYTPSETHAVLPAGVPDTASSTQNEPKVNGYTDKEAETLQRAIDGMKPNVEIVLEEEEPIDVAIDQTTPLQSHEKERAESKDVTRRRAFEDDKEDDDIHEIAPQVVIHSTESDSDSAGFATLNPIINRSSSRGKRSGSFAMATGPGAAVNPVLMSLPISEEVAETAERMVLVINALGATGLSKVEKFGTQSALLEMRVCESTEELSSGATHLSFLRTALHKKGGSEAQWNQQFTAVLRSKTKQSLHVSVRTHSKLLVGQAKISLADVKDTLYDRHFTIYKTGNDGVREGAGQVHLQLRIADTAEFAPQAPVAPSAKAAVSTISEAERSRLIPPALRHGALMFKVPFHTHALMGSSATKRQWISVSGDGVKESISITWCDPIDTTEKSRRLETSLITEIREGARTKAFERLLQNEPSSVAREVDRCFSIISKTRTLDLVASSKEETQIWVEGLRKIVFPSDIQGLAASDPSVTTIQDFRYSAMTTRDATTLSTMTTTSKKQQLAQWRNSVFEYARQRQLSAVSACLHDGCPIDLLETGTGDTLLMLACRVGDAKLVEICLQWRAKNDPHPEFGETALQVAVNAGHSECLDLILRTAAKSDMDSEIVNHIDSNNDAPLHVAARNGDLACIQLLLHHGADVCVVEEFGRTPLHCATLSGSLDCVAYLLDVGGDSVLNAGDHDGDTALHYSALAGRENIVRLLLESAANVDSTNAHGETPYDLAVRENHEDCVSLIASYSHHSTTQDNSVPSTRNETASSLLLMQQKSDQVEYDQATEGMDDVDDEDVDEEDLEAYVEPSNSPVRRGPITPSHTYEDEPYYEDEGYYSSSSSRRGSTSSRHHSQPISPSARVREVLATHRERRSMARGSPVPSLHFHSARDDIHSRFMLVPTLDLPVRHAYTDRIDRDMLEYRRDPYLQHPSHYEYDHPSHHYDPRGYRRMDPYMGIEDRRYGLNPQSSRGRSMSAQASPGYHPVDPYRQGYEQYHENPHPSYPRRSTSADMTYQHPSGAWHDYQQPHVQPIQPFVQPAQPPAQPIPEPGDVWDTYYSEEGYPYYVNRVTGVSQWENPNNPVASPLRAPVSAAAVAPLDVSSALHAHAVAEATTPSAPLTDTQEPISVAHPQANSRERVQPNANESTRSSQIVANSFETSAPDPTQSPCASPTSSKYESRTGLRLSVDIACAPRQDETRPVYVPSPRARSPRKASTTGDPAYSSFEKTSRPSSPRGKTKNVQLIELKRANNLAMALASFKIIDRNDQIVHGIASLDENVVNAELLVCLQRYFPTDEEAAQHRAYQGPMKSLGKAERFFFQLLQVPDVAQRIDCFLYKLQFARNYRSVYSKIQVVKRACRDLIENFSFIEALDEFFASMKSKSLQVFSDDKYLFQTEFLPRVDEKLHSFREDLQKASEIEMLDVQLQINRLLTGIRPIHAFVEKTAPTGDQDTAAHDILQRFLVETRGKLADLETEYEVLGQWEDKVLGLFGESKASCQLAPILECLCAVLEKQYGFIL